MKQKLRLAVQKSGRLLDDSIRLLNNCGIYLDNGRNQLKVPARNFDLEVFFLRNIDIPQYLEDDVVDIAIIGRNTLVEKQSKALVINELGFSKCRLSLAIPKDLEYVDRSYFNHKKIATSYPNTLKAYLDSQNLTAEIHQISGSVEIAPNIGLADAILDLVSSGSTLFQNNLKEVEVILKSEAVLAKSNRISEEKQALLNKLVFRIEAVQKADQYKYILMNIPTINIENILEILPVLESPTILPLAKPDWSSVHTVIPKDKFWDIIYLLKQAGAKDILVMPIEKMML